MDSNGQLLFAESEESGRKWLKNAGQFNKSAAPKIHPSFLLNIDLAPLPSQYPNTIAKLKSLISSEDTLRLDKFLGGIAENIERSKSAIILKFPAASGFGLMGLRVCPPDKKYGANSTKTPNGFRPGRASESIKARNLINAHLSGFSLRRLDPNWVHGRDANGAIQNLGASRILVLGAGSLGSSIINELSKSGVGSIEIVDPEKLEPENTSRHTEGIGEIDEFKGASIAARLTRAFPHHEVKFLTDSEGNGAKWQDLYHAGELNFGEYDLVICATGDWNSENLLSEIQEKEKLSVPIIYTWFARRALAAHTVLTFGGRGCIRCVIDEFGDMILPSINFPEALERVKTPACAGAFEPYGSLDATQGALVPAKLALECLLNETKTATHRVWVGKRKAIKNVGADWNADWEAINGAIGEGERVIEAKSFPSARCRGCGRLTGAAA